MGYIMVLSERFYSQGALKRKIALLQEEGKRIYETYQNWAYVVCDKCNWLICYVVVWED